MLFLPLGPVLGPEPGVQRSIGDRGGANGSGAICDTRGMCKGSLGLLHGSLNNVLLLELHR